MKKFRNKKTGLIEIVTNEMLIEQYEKHTDAYEEVKEKASKPAKEDKKAE